MFSRIKNIIRIPYLAYHDALTGVLNRNWFYTHEKELSMKYKYVYFIDINNLHEINKDGHTFGDNRIKIVVYCINDTISEKDVFVRYAGDEFLVFSNESDLLVTNKLFTVGVAEIKYADLRKAVIMADMDMLKNKDNARK